LLGVEEELEELAQNLVVQIMSEREMAIGLQSMREREMRRGTSGLPMLKSKKKPLEGQGRRRHSEYRRMPTDLLVMMGAFSPAHTKHRSLVCLHEEIASGKKSISA
jgi:hypothetical protein